MTRIKVNLVYDTYGTVYVNLPEGVDPDSISRIDVKWENGEITLDDKMLFLETSKLVEITGYQIF